MESIGGIAAGGLLAYDYDCDTRMRAISICILLSSDASGHLYFTVYQKEGRDRGSVQTAGNTRRM